MDAIVTARVPVELKEQGASILANLGSTPSRLVNAAYEFLIATHRLPTVSGERPAAMPAADQIADALAYVGASSAEAPASFWTDLGNRDYSDVLSDGRGRDYEGLA